MALRAAFTHQNHISRDVRLSILALVPVFVAVGALLGAMFLMALAMLRLLPDGFVFSFHGLSTALMLACGAMIFDRLTTKDAGWQFRGSSAAIRKVRTFCLSARRRSWLTDPYGDQSELRPLRILLIGVVEIKLLLLVFPDRVVPWVTRFSSRSARRAWVSLIGLNPAAYGTHSLRRTKVALVYKRTGNLRACQLLLGHTKLESTVRYLGIEADDALILSEQTDL